MTIQRDQYVKDRYKTRKLSNDCCSHCRDPTKDNDVRVAIDRFDLLWASKVIQNRLTNDWFKDVRKIDNQLISVARQLRSLAPTDPAVASINVELLSLSQARSALRPIQKALDRRTKSSATHPLFAERIAACIAAYQAAAQASVAAPEHIQAICSAVINFQTTAGDEAEQAQDASADGFVSRVTELRSFSAL